MQKQNQGKANVVNSKSQLSLQRAALWRFCELVSCIVQLLLSDNPWLFGKFFCMLCWLVGGGSVAVVQVRTRLTCQLGNGCCIHTCAPKSNMHFCCTCSVCACCNASHIPLNKELKDVLHHCVRHSIPDQHDNSTTLATGITIYNL